MRDGGLMITGNMNVNRPQKDFLHGLMGWVPNVMMRSIKEGFKLLQKSGIPKEFITATVTASGVYTVFAIET
ncbi:hypothetical protein KOY48_04455 [Candidatus Minimicrobia naudis]|uniref:Uncharacterized protein n=1 Tax=Candidatus Minimicrobia naudis TaxID=2841263 RepID=A0A8F1MCN0_9BACT|nr:hypothetical protein KOY48_04455 [Candidatus Minimicrobia naudis]